MRGAADDEAEESAALSCDQSRLGNSDQRFDHLSGVKSFLRQHAAEAAEQIRSGDIGAYRAHRQAVEEIYGRAGGCLERLIPVGCFHEGPSFRPR